MYVCVYGSRSGTERVIKLFQVTCPAGKVGSREAVRHCMS